MSRPRLATAWLDGCAGCHMSLLDLDEAILELPVEVVYGPLVDTKEVPEADLALVEGAVGTEEQLELLRTVRERARILVALGDCAVTGNVSSLRNGPGAAACLQRAYGDRPPAGLLPTVTPVHEHVAVDVFVPGCPPPPAAILHVLTELLEGRTPDPSSLTRFGA